MSEKFRLNSKFPELCAVGKDRVLRAEKDSHSVEERSVEGVELNIPKKSHELKKVMRSAVAKLCGSTFIYFLLHLLTVDDK